MAEQCHIVSTNKEALFCFDTRLATDLDAETFPFRSVLSLAPLINFWRQAVTGQKPARVALGKMAQETLRRAPELLEPIEDFSVVEQHKDLIDILMSTVFPPASWEQDYMAALVPFQLRSFYATPSFERLLMTDDGMVSGCLNIDSHTVAWAKVTHAYTAILQQIYGVATDFDYPLIFSALDPDTGLNRHFQVQFDSRFIEVKTVGDAPPLSDHGKQELRANLANTELLMDKLPPDRFVFQGFAVFNAVEVTEQQVLSSLKRELIDRESIVSNVRFQNLQNEMRTLFRCPHLTLGVAALMGEQILMLDGGRQMDHGCIFADSAHYRVKDFTGSVYERAVTQGELLLIDDLTTYPERTAIEERLLQAGVRNMIIAPLYYRDQLIGTLELWSPRLGDLHAINAIKLREVLPLFSMAIKRSMDELNTSVQAVIKEQCTAIHPTVEWKFRQAVAPYMQQRAANLPAEMAPIVFENIYPLYGVSDIRGSSTHRNDAIQGDLAEHLRMTQAILQTAYGAKPLPILDDMAHHVSKHLCRIEADLSSGDELTILDFLHREIEPLFDHLQTFAPEVEEKIEAYRAAIAPQLGTLYRRRKDFEDSVTLINDTISAYLDTEEEKAQAMFPHYFEKHKSDGVEYGIYIGAALVENGQFNDLYLHNIRLWQLMVTCGIVRQMVGLRARLKLPLETAHLILVQHTPLSIRFRFDEKRFDVDGAYNMRYEIVKKRIDKATIRGTGERLTQPGKIAIVYSQAKEATEYRDYIEYLHTAGYLTGDIEDVGLDDLQGAQGLKALRVTVAMPDAMPERHVMMEEIGQAVRTIDHIPG